MGFWKGISKRGVAHTSFTNNFTGAVSTSWNTAGNWSLGVVPTSTQDVLISSNCTLDTSPTVRRMTIGIGITLTFGTTARTLTVNNDFNCLGTVNMNSNTHTLSLKGIYNACNSLVTDSNNSTVNYSNSTGSIGQQVFASANYRNLTVVFKATQGSGSGVECVIVGGNSITIANTLNQGSAFVIANGQSVVVNGTGSHTVNNTTIKEGGNITFTNTCSLAMNETTINGDFTIGTGATVSVTATNTVIFGRYSRCIATNSTSKYKTVSGGTLQLSMEDNVAQFMSGGLYDFTGTTSVAYNKVIYAGITAWGTGLKVLANSNYGGNLSLTNISGRNPIIQGNITAATLTSTGTQGFDLNGYNLTVSGGVTNLGSLVGAGSLRAIGSLTTSSSSVTLSSNIFCQGGFTCAGSLTYTSGTLYFDTNNQNISITGTRAITNVYVDAKTITKTGTGALTITNLDGSGSGTSIFNGSGTTTVTTVSANVTYNP